MLLPPRSPCNITGCLSSPTGPGCHPRPLPLCLESSSACLAPIPSLPRSHALTVVLANPTGRAGSAMSEVPASLPTASPHRPLPQAISQEFGDYEKRPPPAASIPPPSSPPSPNRLLSPCTGLGECALVPHPEAFLFSRPLLPQRTLTSSAQATRGGAVHSGCFETCPFVSRPFSVSDRERHTR